MKKIKGFLFPFVSVMLLFSCKSKDEGAKDIKPQSYNFTISGQIKNIKNQQIYLQSLSFSSAEPVMLDTANIQNGSFNMSANATEEGLYRILTSDGASFIFVNDQNNLSLSADGASLAVQNTTINSPSNLFLKTMITELEKRSAELNQLSQEISMIEEVAEDSNYLAKKMIMDKKVEEYNNFLLAKFKETKDPILATIALGNTSFPDPTTIKTYVDELSKRFPDHKGIAAMVKEYNNPTVTGNEENSTDDANQAIAVGKPAPNFTLNDVNGKPFSLSSMRGQYVLVDFWASWCGPCRGENPNVVAAYNKLKNKNFTVLGVSLDEENSEWMNAIKEDKLTWKHVSDLKGWGSSVVGLYGITGIPFNVLINPNGIIVGKELRGEDLDKQLAVLIK